MLRAMPRASLWRSHPLSSSERGCGYTGALSVRMRVMSKNWAGLVNSAAEVLYFMHAARATSSKACVQGE